MTRSARTPAHRQVRARIGVLLVLFGCAPPAALAAGDSYVGRPVYSEPSTGLQLPPTCQVEPSWRTAVPNSELEIWVAQCGGESRVWLLRKQVLEVVNGRQARLRFEIMDERSYTDEVPGETLSVQCSGSRDESGYVVRGARWRENGKELRLKGARGVLRAELRNQTLADTEIGGVDCARFPEREAMMKRLQQTHN